MTQTDRNQLIILIAFLVVFLFIVACGILFIIHITWGMDIEGVASDRLTKYAQEPLIPEPRQVLLAPRRDKLNKQTKERQTMPVTTLPEPIKTVELPSVNLPQQMTPKDRTNEELTKFNFFDDRDTLAEGRQVPSKLEDYDTLTQQGVVAIYTPGCQKTRAGIPEIKTHTIECLYDP